jgi:hypothetical protein
VLFVTVSHIYHREHKQLFILYKVHMKNSVRVIAALLAAAAVITLIPSCASGGDKNSSSETTASGDTTSTETTGNLESLTATDFGGADFNILCRTEKEYEIWTEAENGEVVNDAVFKRNTLVDEKYNVAVKSVPVTGSWDTQATFLDAVKKSVQAGDNAYDLVAEYLAYGVTLGIDGYFLNLDTLEGLDTTSSWWAKGFVDNNTVNNCLFFIAGDLSLTMWESMYGFFFNKVLAEDYNIGDLYSLVTSGGWTLAKLNEYAKLVSGDVNGDGLYTNADLYGYVTNNHSVRAFVTSCDVPIASRNSDGYYDFVYGTDKVMTLYDTVRSMIFDGNYIFVNKTDGGDEYVDVIPMFMDNRALFISGSLDNTEKLRDMKSDFGIIPFPKYDEAQTNYISHAYDGMSMFSVPKSVKDTKMSGTVTEALCAASKDLVIPAFYDITLQTKVTRDTESQAMLDLIRQTVYFDFGYVHSVAYGGVFQLFGDSMLITKAPSYTSTFEKQSKTLQKKFDKVIEAYEEITG